MKHTNIPRYLNNYINIGEAFLNVNEFNTIKLERIIEKNSKDRV